MNGVRANKQEINIQLNTIKACNAFSRGKCEKFVGDRCCVRLRWAIPQKKSLGSTMLNC